MRDYSAVIDSTEKTIIKMGGDPLSEIQRMAMAASFAVWTEKYIDEALALYITPLDDERDYIPLADSESPLWD